MKIVLRIYKEIRIGNLSTMILDIPNNKLTVKDLKERIYHKYKIKPSEQRLTFRICHKKLITLTDNFPLNYFYIKEYSMLFLEIISNDMSEKSLIKKADKKKDSIKFKYMNVLGYFLPDSKTLQRNQNISSLKNSFNQEKKVNSFNNGNNDSESFLLYERKNSLKSDGKKFTEEESVNSLIIVNDEESENNNNIISNNKNSIINKMKTMSFKEEEEEEDKNNKSNIKLKKGLSSPSEIAERLCLYVKQNDFEKVSKLLSQYSLDINDSNENSRTTRNTNYKTNYSFNSGNNNPNSNITNSNICELLNKNGWNAIHYSSYYGNEEILNFIINKLNIKSNLNVLNNEGWSPLLLATYKQQIKCVEILISDENIDVNYNGPIGTALHIACKKNNRHIVSKLLNKANPTIKDKFI